MAGIKFIGQDILWDTGMNDDLYVFDHSVSIKVVAKLGICYHHPHMKISHVSYTKRKTVGGITSLKE